MAEQPVASPGPHGSRYPGLSATIVKYRSQLVAYPYFSLAVLLFLLQIPFGLLLAAQYVWPTFLVDVLPFNIARATHLNLLILWLLLGLMGKVGMSDLMANPHGVKASDITFGDALRKLPAGKVQIAPPEFAAALTSVSAPTKLRDKTFILITGERSPHTKNTNLRGVESLLRKQSENFVRLHPSDAQMLSVSDSDIVEIAAGTRKIRLKARIDDSVRPGVVSIPHGWGRILYHPETSPQPEQQGVNVNILTDDSCLDSFTGMPLYNAIPCSVRKIF